MVFEKRGEFAGAEELYLSLRSQCPESAQICLRLGKLYVRRKDYAKAEEMYREAGMINPDDETYHVFMGDLFFLQKDYVRAEKYLEAADRLLYRKPGHGFSISAGTAANYRKLLDRLKRDHIKVVCMQYPLLSVEPLREMLRGSGDAADVYFVSNERSFRGALAREEYFDYFVDKFACGFGHCTEKGNRLVAKNIADALLWHVMPGTAGGRPHAAGNERECSVSRFAEAAGERFEGGKKP
jgi:tetratricopeptide (TPR) repeat protein